MPCKGDFGEVAGRVGRAAGSSPGDICIVGWRDPHLAELEHRASATLSRPPIERKGQRVPKLAPNPESPKNDHTSSIDPGSRAVQRSGEQSSSTSVQQMEPPAPECVVRKSHRTSLLTM
jgi:hypothetical protein